MIVLFVSIVLVTASIASGVLFYFTPPVSHVPKKDSIAFVSKPSLSPSIALAIPLENQSIPTPMQSVPTQSGSGPIPSVSPSLSSESLSEDDSNRSLIFAADFLPPSPTPTLTFPVVTTIPQLSLMDIQVSLTPTPLPTMTPTAIPTPTPSTGSGPTPIQSGPTAIPSLTQIPASTNAPTGGLNADVLFQLVNDYRSKMGLSGFQKDEKTCTVASQRAPQIYNEIYGTGIMHAGLKRMQLPYWITENIISMDTEQKAFDWWIHDTIHRQAIEGNYTNSCVACSGNSCSEVFTSFVPK